MHQCLPYEARRELNKQRVKERSEGNAILVCYIFTGDSRSRTSRGVLR